MHWGQPAALFLVGMASERREGRMLVTRSSTMARALKLLGWEFCPGSVTGHSEEPSPGLPLLGSGENRVNYIQSALAWSSNCQVQGLRLQPERGRVGNARTPGSHGKSLTPPGTRLVSPSVVSVQPTWRLKCAGVPGQGHAPVRLLQALLVLFPSSHS